MKSDTEMWLKDVWGSSATDVFAVGESGTILQYDGSNWSKVTSGTTKYLYGIWGSSATDVFAVGESGTILHYNGTSWSSVDSGTVEHLRDIWGSSADDVFVVGDNSTILHYNGSSWSSINSGTTAWLLGIWGSSGMDVFAVGGYYDGTGGWSDRASWDGGVILHYDGISWTEMKNDIAEHLYSVWGSSATDAFAVGAYGTILQYDGGDDDPAICATERIYGEDSRETVLLRNFRDDFLSKTPEGQGIIKLYYQWSPAIVKAMEEDEAFKKKIKEMVDEVLPLIIKGVE